MDIVDRCQVARDDMNLVRQLSGALANLQAGTAYLDNEPDLPPQLEQKYQRMARKLDRLEATVQELLSESESWLNNVEREAHNPGDTEAR